MYSFEENGEIAAVLMARLEKDPNDFSPFVSVANGDIFAVKVATGSVRIMTITLDVIPGSADKEETVGSIWPAGHKPHHSINPDGLIALSTGY